MTFSYSPDQLKTIAQEVRYKIIQMSNRAQTAHLAGALSCVDLLVALYWTYLKIDTKNPHDPNRDRLIFSKGHAVSALYAVLAKKGFFPETDLDDYNHEEGHLPEQPCPGCAPGVEWATGSLGHGLGVGLGMALAAQIQKRDYRTAVLLSDGECQEGSVWEAAMLAPRLQLKNLMAIVDFNQWQATARSNEVMCMEPLRSKWESFGWRSLEVDAHDMKAILDAMHSSSSTDQPLAIIARGVKGKGISFMEDDNNWHYRSPSDEEVVQAKIQLLGDRS